MKTKLQFTKQILSIVLCICMILTYVPLKAFAAKQHTHPICGAVHTEVGEHTGNCSDITWQEWNNETIMPTEAGAYYLANNVTLSNTWEIPKDVEISLCLNGYSISGNNAVRVISVGKTATLNVCDCSSQQTGKITEGNAKNLSGGGVYVPTNSTFNLYGGSITNNKASYQGGGIFIFGGTFHMYGGTISNNSANIAAGVYNVNDGTAYMYAGAISENVSIDLGGGIFTSGFFHMQGGVISENNSGKDHGDGVYVNAGSFVMSGGEVSDNDPVSDKGIYVGALSRFMIFGKPMIKDAIYLHSNEHGIAYITVCGELDDEVKIPATNRRVGELLAKGTDTYSLAETDIAKFTSTNGKIILDSMNNRLVICDDSHPDYEDGACKTCDAECVHSFVYEADENVITEKCNANSNCGHNATATLAVDSNVSTIYSGNEIKPLKVEYSDDWFGGDLVVSYTNNTNVGKNASASGSITIKEVTYTATKSFEIKAADISNATITLNPESGKYTGMAYEPDATVTLDGFGTLKKDTDYTVSWNGAFTDADTHTVTVTGIGNFTGKTTQAFTINAASLANIEVKQVGTLTYNGEAQTPVVSASAVAVNDQTVTFTYSTDFEHDNSFTETVPAFTSAGEHLVYYKVSAPNHKEETGNFEVKIEKATITEPTIASKSFNNNTQAADIKDTDLYTVAQNNGGVNRGVYDVVLTLKDNKNYSWETTDNTAVTLKFEITQATNEWETEPSISDWTYGGTAGTPTYKAEFGSVSVKYSGTANDGTTWDSETAPLKAGSYIATFTVTGNDNYTTLSEDVPFTITKGNQNKPAVKSNNETISGKKDGYISSVDSTMEYRKENNTTYTAISGNKIENLAPGKYYVRVKGDSNHNPSEDTVVTIAAGRKLIITVPSAAEQIGYTIEAETSCAYGVTVEIKITALEGYGRDENFDVYNNGNLVSNQYNSATGILTLENVTEDVDITLANGSFVDRTKPTAEITLGTNKWNTFWNGLTFGLFFKETQTVTITADDKGSGLDKVYYYISENEMERIDVNQITAWQEYTGAFNIDPDRVAVIYVKAVDKAGNLWLVNSDGLVLDATAPTLEGIENGKTYYGDLTVIKPDGQFGDIEQVTLDGKIMYFVEGTYGLIPADNAEHIVVVTDKAGNKTEYKITVYKVYEITFKHPAFELEFPVNYGASFNEAHPDTVQDMAAAKDYHTFIGWYESTDGGNTLKDTPYDFSAKVTGDVTLYPLFEIFTYTVTYKADGKVVGTVEVEHGQDATAPAVPEKEGYTQTAPAWDKDGKAITADTEINAVYTVNEYTITFMSENGVYQTIKVKHGEKVTMPEAPKKDGYTVTWEKSLDTVTGDVTIKAVYTEIPATDKPSSPQTGDNSNMVLWFALLSISGGAVIMLTGYDRKRKNAVNSK